MEGKRIIAGKINTKERHYLVCGTKLGEFAGIKYDDGVPTADFHDKEIQFEIFFNKEDAYKWIRKKSKESFIFSPVNPIELEPGDEFVIRGN